jgi:hypothetical protein
MKYLLEPMLSKSAHKKSYLNEYLIYLVYLGTKIYKITTYCNIHLESFAYTSFDFVEG